jgi:hypothetical protein
MNKNIMSINNIADMIMFLIISINSKKNFTPGYSCK